jgi:hypothetical protein
LIALLLLKWLHYLSQANWSLSNLASMLRLNLFTYGELTKWLHDPMQTPPPGPRCRATYTGAGVACGHTIGS